MTNPVGVKHNIIGAEHWPCISIPKNPSRMPEIPKGHKVVCGLECDDGELVFICETLDVVERLQAEATAHRTNISWYHTDVFN
jgi:hypothetical protein